MRAELLRAFAAPDGTVDGTAVLILLFGLLLIAANTAGALVAASEWGWL